MKAKLDIKSLGINKYTPRGSKEGAYKRYRDKVFMSQTEEELIVIIVKMELRLQGVDVYNTFPLYRKVVANLKRRIDVIKEIKTA